MTHSIADVLLQKFVQYVVRTDSTPKPEENKPEPVKTDHFIPCLADPDKFAENNVLDLGGLKDTVQTILSNGLASAPKEVALAMTIPLAQGLHRIKTSHGDLKITVYKDTEIKLKVKGDNLGDQEGSLPLKMSLDSLDLQFTKPILLRNPGTAIGKKGVERDLINRLTNVSIDGVKKLKGKAAVVEKEIKFAVLHSVLSIISAKAGNSNQEMDLPEVSKEMLGSVMSMLAKSQEPSKMVLDIEHNRKVMTVQPNETAPTETKETNLGLHIEGTLKFCPDGFSLDFEDDRSKLRCNGIDLPVSGSMDVRQIFGTPHVDLKKAAMTLPSNTWIHAAKGIALKAEFAKLTLERLSGDLQMTNGPKAAAESGTFKLLVKNPTLVEPEFGASVMGQMLATSRLISLQAQQIKIKSEKTGETEKKLDLKAKVTYEVDIDLHPDALKGNKRLRNKEFKTDGLLDYDLLAGGGRLVPGKHDLTSIGNDIAGMDALEKRLKIDLQPWEGCELGNEAFCDQITDLTGAPVTTGNYTKTLKDGIEVFPKLMEMIGEAKKSICIQTLLLGSGDGTDETAGKIVDAVVQKARDGVPSYIHVDSLGAIRSLDDIESPHVLHECLRYGLKVQEYLDLKAKGPKHLEATLQELGRSKNIHFALYNDRTEKASRSLLKQVRELSDRGLVEFPKQPQIKDLIKAMIQIFGGTKCNLDKGERDKLLGALKQFMFEHDHVPQEKVEGLITRFAKTRIADTQMLMALADMFKGINKTRHGKCVIIDGGVACMTGGILNLTDHYLKGGTGFKYESHGKTRIDGVRDTGQFISGPAGRCVYSSFVQNMKSLMQIAMPAEATDEEISQWKSDHKLEGDTKLQYVWHNAKKSSINGDMNFTVTRMLALEAALPGDEIVFANAYFLPPNMLVDSMIKAAKRGVKVRILTNGENSNDVPQLPKACVFPVRKLLAEGIGPNKEKMIHFHVRTQCRTMHQKMELFIRQGVTVVTGNGTCNLDRRSPNTQEENGFYMYDKKENAYVTKMIRQDFEMDVAKEIFLKDVDRMKPFTMLVNAGNAVIGGVL